MRIERTPAAARTAKPPATKASGFAEYVNAGAPAGAARQAAPTMMVGGLIAAQSEDDAAGSRSRGLRQANDLLNDLDALHRQLSIGAITPAHLHGLERRLDAADMPDDPRLAGVMADIQLRVAVEIAKHQRI
ncbi:MAG: flagellar assembly protein FliX [Pacificimonas sp.]